MAGHIQWLGFDGYLPSASDVMDISFQTADKLDPAADNTGSLVIQATAGGEIVKSLQVADDYVLSKVRLCFSASPDPTGEVIVKIYQGNPGPMASVPVQTNIVFQSESFVPVAGCNEVLVLDPADPTSAIDPSQGPLYLGIKFVGTGLTEYLKAVGIEDNSVEIGTCGTGLEDRFFDPDTGKMLSEVIDEIFTNCENDPKTGNHGKFVKCVSHELNALKKSGEITGKEKGKIQKCAAKSDIGK